MNCTKKMVYTGLLCSLVACGSAFGKITKLTIKDYGNVDRRGDAVTTGIPFDKGTVKDVSLLNVLYNDRPIPAQFVPIVPWPDGSVRWALLDTQAGMPAGEKVELTVVYGKKTVGPSNGIKIVDDEESLKVSTGPLDFAISKKKFNLFESLHVDGKEVLTSAGKGLVIIQKDGSEVLAGPPTEIVRENDGPMRTTICLRGRFPGVHKNLLGYTVRLTAYAGSKYVKMHVWFENDGGLSRRAPGRENWFAFDGMALDFGLNLGNKIEAESEGVKAFDKFRIAQYATPNYDWKSFNYKVTSGGQELKTGDRTDGVVALRGANGKLNVAVRHFWENYEKAIELDNSNLKVWLWPTDGEWPRTTIKRGMDDSSEFSQYRVPGLYHLSGGTRKGHELILDFSGRDAAATRATLATPLMAMAVPGYYSATEAVNGWMAPADMTTGKAEYDEAVARWNKVAMQAIDANDKNGSLIAARQGKGDSRGFWYGWMDFGDNLWAEGYSSLHYDWTWMMALNLLRTGERGFYDMAVSMARHRADIDQIWAGESQFYNNLSRYEKCFTSVHGGINDGHYGPIPTHNWISGVILMYMITGENHYKDCALNNHAGMKRRLIDPQNEQPKPSIQTRELGWTILNLCSLYDMTADKKYLDDAMIIFNKPLTMQWKERGPYFGATGGNCLQFYYSTQGLCELHHHTGNPEVLKLIKEGCEGDYEATRPAYKEWSIFLSNYYAYVGYKENNEDYIKKAEELFKRYVNETRNMNCYNPGGGAWDKESGKFLRNGHILQFVEWKRKKIVD